MDVVAVEHDLQDRADRDAFSGAVRIDQDGATLLRRAYGWASPTWRVPASADTRFDTASITKLFTAVATLQLIEAGSFTLKTSAVDYLELTSTKISPDVTVYQLLTHTSGIGDDADEEAGEAYADLFTERPNYAIREASDHLPNFVHRHSNFAPGGGTRYCNCSYVLLGLMVERATGIRYRDYVRRHVFAPAAMKRSDFFAMDVVEPDVAEGLTPILGADGARTGWRRSIYSYPPVGTPDGGAHCTVDDLVAFHTSLRAGQLLGSDLTTAMLSPHEDYRPMQPGHHRTGYGFEFQEIDGRVRTYWKEGSNTGVSGILQHFPETDITVAVLSNLDDGAWEPIQAIEQLIVG